MSDIDIARTLEVEGVYKEYRLGAIGGGTLHGDFESWLARIRGKEDPNRKIGSNKPTQNGFFMALSDVTFNADRGDAMGILGRNGAGKSTLLKLISRITAPTKGEIRIRGRVASLLEIGTGFHQELTGRENIYLNGAILGMTRNEITAKMKEIIEFSEIEKFIDTPVKRYSSGMFVKLAFAVAAHLDPDILICDEVLAVGDVNFQQKCLGKMRDVARGGRSVLYVSHNMRTVAQLCTRAIYIEQGHLLYDGEVAHAMELYSGSGMRTQERDLDSLPRGRMRGESARMLKMTIHNSDDMSYTQDGAMEFTLSARSAMDIRGLRLRFILLAHNTSPLAMTQTKPFEVKAGENFAIRVKVPLDGIAPGEYAIKLSLIDSNLAGNSTYYDTVDNAGNFTIREDTVFTEGFNWLENLWGNFKMAPLEMERVE